MERYIDTNGEEVLAYCLNGPMVLNTIKGEMCGSIGEWVLVLNDGRCTILNNEDFNISFKKVEV